MKFLQNLLRFVGRNDTIISRYRMRKGGDMSRDLIHSITQQMPGFSKGQKLIAQYILEHYDKAAFMTAAKLGMTVGVSESTVVRFASELGFEGYPQLQRALQELIRNRLTSVQRMEVTSDQLGEGNILHKVLNMDIERIRRTMEKASIEDFEQTVNTIIHAKNIYILGVRSASALSGFMSFYFNQIFDSVRLVNTTSTSEMFEQIMRIKEGDVFIGITFPRYSKRTVNAASFAKQSGAKSGRHYRFKSLSHCRNGRSSAVGAQRYGFFCRFTGSAAERHQRPDCSDWHPEKRRNIQYLRAFGTDMGRIQCL